MPEIAKYYYLDINSVDWNQYEEELKKIEQENLDVSTISCTKVESDIIGNYVNFLNFAYANTPGMTDGLTVGSKLNQYKYLSEDKHRINWETLLMDKNDNIIGCLTITGHKYFDTIELNFIFILEEHRGKNLSELLIYKALQTINRIHKFSGKIKLQTHESKPQAFGLLKKLGFYPEN